MVKKVIEIDVIAPNAQQNINSVTSSLNNATKSSDNLNKTLGGDKGAGKFAGLKDIVGNISPAFDKASTGASAFNKQLLVLLANPIGLVIAAIVLAVAGLVAIFKTFQPLVDKVEQSVAALGSVLNVIKNTFIAVVTGTKSLGDAFNGLGDDMSSAAKRTMELVKAQQDLDDVLAKQEVTSAKTRSEINKLNVQAKNRSLTEAERLKLLEQAAKLEDQDFKQRVKNANEEVRIAREAIAIKAGFNAAEIKLLKEQGLAAKELAESKGGNYDEEFKALAAAQKNRIGLEDESTANLEKNQNRRDALEDAQAAKRLKRQEDAKAAQKVIDDARIAAQKVKEEADNAELKAFNDLLAKQRQIEFDSLNASRDALDKATEENINRTLTNDEVQIRAVKDKYFSLIEIARQNGLDTLELEIAQANEINDINLKSEESKREDAERTAELKKILAAQELDMVQETFGKIADLAGKNSKIGKAFAVGQALINTYQGISAQIATKPNTPYEIGLVIANVATVAATGFKAVKQILATNPMASSGSGSGGAVSGGGGGASSAAPQFNLVGQSSTNQLAQTISTQQAQPIRTYVVAGDVSTQQAADRNAVQTSTFGG
jgi:hypothetical protein